MTTHVIRTMSDREVLDAAGRLVADERAVTADLLALLGELDARRRYLSEGCSSLFTYCTQVLHLSEHAAYHRIEAARAARRCPVILQLVRDGSVTLTGDRFDDFVGTETDAWREGHGPRSWVLRRYN